MPVKIGDHFRRETHRLVYHHLLLGYFYFKLHLHIYWIRFEQILLNFIKFHMNR